jgi:hypothetical protein
MAHRLAYGQVISLVMNSLYLEWDEEAGERVVARSSAVLSPLHIGGENERTEFR